MKRYLLKRFIHSILTIYIAATLVFFVSRAAPGDPVRTIAPNANPETAQAIRESMGLDQPWYIQYYDWMSGLFKGNLGTSITQDLPVLDLLIQVSEPTVSIALLGISISLLIGIPGGIISALRRYKPEDYIVTILSFMGISMPGFWIGILLVLLVATRVEFFAGFGYTEFSEGFVPWMSTIILPAFAVGIPYGGIILRFMRSSMLDVMNKDYITNAKAKGLDWKLVVFKHAFQNALIPVITIGGIVMAIVLAGVVAVEIVFGINGLGRLLINSLEQRDFPVLQGAVVVISAVFVFLMLAVDIMYTIVNPKVKYGDNRT
jgi:peptide/nickel transport system permease protein